MSARFNDPSLPNNFVVTSAPSASVSNSQSSSFNAAPFSSKPKNIVSVRKNAVSEVGVKCPIHNDDQVLTDCRTFRKKSLSERKSTLKRGYICFKCCASNSHGFRDCNIEIHCAECGSKNHHTILHGASKHRNLHSLHFSRQLRQMGTPMVGSLLNSIRIPKALRMGR